MNKLFLALLAAATALATGPAAMADALGVTTTSGAVTFNGSGVTSASGTGTVEGNPSTTGVFAGLITDTVTFYSFSSTVGSPEEAFSIGSGITGTTFTIDTLPTYSYLNLGEGSGLLGLAGTGVVVDDGTSYDVTFTGSGNDTAGITYSFSLNDITVTPEPSSLVLLGTGLLGLAFLAFRKAKSTGMALSM